MRANNYYTSTNLLIYKYRFVDRDMVMRYHWGLAVGHTYAHRRTSFEPNTEGNTHQQDEEYDLCGDELPHVQNHSADEESGCPPESDTDDDDGPIGIPSGSDDLEYEDGSIDSDGEFLAMDEMYG